jgi:hypothetical protein
VARDRILPGRRGEESSVLIQYRVEILFRVLDEAFRVAMGANESRSHEEVDDAAAAQDYYAILEVDENASADEIRVSSYAIDDWLCYLIIKAARHDSDPSDGLHSSITRTKTTTTPKVQPDVLPRCSRRMRCVWGHSPQPPSHLILDNLYPPPSPPIGTERRAGENF